jgi:two-component system cell cycle response regulator DivK
MAKQILYVEDNQNNVLLVQRILVAEGHQLLQARDAATGWETAVSHLPDLILMDLHLPGEISGLELTRRLKQTPALQHIPIVALTAHDSAEVETAALAAGCSGFLRKPADLRQIRQTLHTFLHGTETAVTAQPVSPAYTFI